MIASPLNFLVALTFSVVITSIRQRY